MKPATATSIREIFQIIFLFLNVNTLETHIKKEEVGCLGNIKGGKSMSSMFRPETYPYILEMA